MLASVRIKVSMSKADELIDRLISMCDIQHDIIAEIEEAALHVNEWDTLINNKYVV